MPANKGSAAADIHIFSNIHVHAQAPVGMATTIALPARTASVPPSGALSGTAQTGMTKACLPNASRLVAVPPKWLVHASSLASSQAPPATSSPPHQPNASLPSLLPGRVTSTVAPRARRIPQRQGTQLITIEKLEGLIGANKDLKESAVAMGVW
jgi:hypothetical protein